MSRSRNWQKGKQNCDLWGARPMSGRPHSAQNKRICRKLERVRAKRTLKDGLSD